MLTPQQKTALKDIATASVAAERATGCPAELSAAQAILESGWLTRCPGNNCFGIKANARTSGEVYVYTHEVEFGESHPARLAFAAYPTLAACFTDHAWLITHGAVYQDAWRQFEQDHNSDALIAGIAPHYATDPQYAELIRRIAHGPDLTAAIATARQSNG